MIPVCAGTFFLGNFISRAPDVKLHGAVEHSIRGFGRLSARAHGACSRRKIWQSITRGAHPSFRRGEIHVLEPTGNAESLIPTKLPPARQPNE